MSKQNNNYINFLQKGNVFQNSKISNDDSKFSDLPDDANPVGDGSTNLYISKSNPGRLFYREVEISGKKKKPSYYDAKHEYASSYNPNGLGEFLSTALMPLNIISPTNLGRGLWNHFVTGTNNNVVQDIFLPNNGVFTDEFAAKHPYITAVGNFVGDMATYGAGAFLSKLPKIKTALTTEDLLGKEAAAKDWVNFDKGIEGQAVYIDQSLNKPTVYRMSAREFNDLANQGKISLDNNIGVIELTSHPDGHATVKPRHLVDRQGNDITVTFRNNNKDNLLVQRFDDSHGAPVRTFTPEEVKHLVEKEGMWAGSPVAEQVKAGNSPELTFRNMTPKQADEAIQFIEKNYGKDFFLHCLRGTSRSGAFDKFLGEYYGYTRPINKSVKGASPEVYQSLVDAYNRNKGIYTGLISKKQGGKMKIHIKKSNRGKFTDYCGGKVTSECIQRGKNSPNPDIRKRATFAANARKWKHEKGGAFVKGVNVLDSNPKAYKHVKKKYKMYDSGGAVSSGSGWQSAINLGIGAIGSILSAKKANSVIDQQKAALNAAKKADKEAAKQDAQLKSMQEALAWGQQQQNLFNTGQGGENMSDISIRSRAYNNASKLYNPNIIDNKYINQELSIDQAKQDINNQLTEQLGGAITQGIGMFGNYMASKNNQQPVDTSDAVSKLQSVKPKYNLSLNGNTVTGNISFV